MLALLAWPVVEDHLHIVDPSTADGLQSEKVMLQSFNVHLLHFSGCSGRLDRSWKILNDQTPVHIWVTGPEADKVMAVDQQDIVFGSLVISKYAVHDVRHFMPLQSERFEAHVVVELDISPAPIQWIQ